MASHYDIKFIFSPVDSECNFFLRLSNALAGYLNQVSKLPRIIVLILDVDYKKITCSYKVTEKAINVLVSAFIMDLMKRKKQLPEFAYKQSEPKLLVMKPAPKSKIRNLDGEECNRRHIFNRSLENILAQYESTFAYNADRLKPEKLELFEDTFIGLSKESLKLYWKDLDNIISLIDINRATPLKQIKEQEAAEE